MRLRDDDARAAVGPLVAAAAGVLGISPERVMSRDQAGLTVMARWAVAHVLYRDRQWSQAQIGQALDRDHSTIHTALRRAENGLRGQDRWFGEVVDAVRRTAFASLGPPPPTARASWAVPRPLVAAGRRAA